MRDVASSSSFLLAGISSAGRRRVHTCVSKQPPTEKVLEEEEKEGNIGGLPGGLGSLLIRSTSCKQHLTEMGEHKSA